MKSIIYSLGRIMLPMILLAVMIFPAIAQQSAAGKPSIEITSPKENASLAPGNITVTVDVNDFNLVSKLGQSNMPGEGHLHYYIDVPVPKTPDKPAMTAVGTFAPTTNTSYIWQNVTAGKHNFSVQLANNDHTPVIPLAFAQVNVTVGDSTGSQSNGTAAAVAGKASENTASKASDQGGKMATVDITARDMEFDKKTISVPAGAKVTVNFDNQDSGIPHNVAIYEDSSASNAIFKGDIITGPRKTTYTFTAPTKPGTYYFQCDVHPSMNGQFVVS